MKELKEKMRMEMELRNFSNRTKEAYIWHLERFSKLFGRSLEELGEIEVREYLHYLRVKRKVSWSNMNIGYSALKFFYVNVLDRVWSVKKIPRSKSEVRLPSVLSRDEVRKIIENVSNRKYKVIMMVIYSSGLRISELANLKIKDIDSGRMQIRIEQGKGKKDRYTILSKKVLEELRDYYKTYHPKEWLFPGKCGDKPIDVGMIQKAFREAKEKAGIEKEVTVHTLRHSFATHLLEQGVNIFVIKELLGHMSIKTTIKYIHIQKADIDKVVSPFDI
jgi:site-specific recombinase XerD